MDKKSRFWFPAKRYGWGWGLPVCWQGWAVLLGYFALMLAVQAIVPPARDMPLSIVIEVVLTAAFLVVVWATGEPLRWR